MATSVYIHIPFCKSKCKYCSFISFPCVNKKDIYLTELIKEIKTQYKGEKLKTLYFGGGTPSLLESSFYETLINLFNLEKDCEITLEFNPDDTNIDYLKSLKKIGVNRLSIGSQTFDDKVLKLIGRRHCSKQIITAVNLAKKAGFDNISLDLIYGLPESNIKKDIKKLLSLNIQHISTYGLKIEEDSYFGKYPPVNLPDEDEQADMYLFINKELEKHGYKRYEISNFAHNGYESKHNLNYWNNDEYYGFGIAAHGYINGIRYSNYTTLEEYINLNDKKDSIQKLSLNEKLEEEIFLGLRKTEGINIKDVNHKYSIDFETKYSSIIKKYSPKFLNKTAEGYNLSTEGVLISNEILSEFID